LFALLPHAATTMTALHASTAIFTPRDTCNPHLPLNRAMTHEPARPMRELPALARAAGSVIPNRDNLNLDSEQNHLRRTSTLDRCLIEPLPESLARYWPPRGRVCGNCSRSGALVAGQPCVRRSDTPLVTRKRQRVAIT